MADEGIHSFEVKNDDVRIRFSCISTASCISRAMKNMRAERDDKRLMAEYATRDKEVRFFFDSEEHTGSVTREAVFFENTSYPTLIEATPGVSSMSLRFSNSPRERALSADGNLLYGAVSFGNQVGKTDVCLRYRKNGREKNLRFTTEVLSYKMDYRSDMKSIIRDIEEEYSMLSFAFMRETYLNFRTQQGKSTDLIWWQIFRSCYDEILSACRQIILSPRRRLHPVLRYERAERLRRLTPDMENEYANFLNEPNHLYRTEDLCHTDDTVENRFLKFVMNGLLNRFQVVSRHIRNTSRSARLEKELRDMEDNLKRMVNHPFFRTIGQFRGFAQDSLVMKRAVGYRTIYQKWIELLCGYELEEGLNQLETKDISTLYEIWCFIKVKNIVEEILGSKAEVHNKGKKLTPRFVRELTWGRSSEVTFVRTDDGVELASVMYNAPTKDENSDSQSAIRGTTSFTTEQRPDIVLRLTKQQKDIQYTFLFDAKYRIADSKKDGMDVPPVEAINQMHRYRDAVYYVDGNNGKLKREVIGGYVLFPGNYTQEEYKQSYYHQSIEKVGIGAFPLRPSHAEDELLVAPNDSEQALREQIEKWLRTKRMLSDLYKKAIPQHGLSYENPDAVVLVNYATAAKRGVMERTGLCYLRTGEDKGAIEMTRDAVCARYVMLHNGKDGTLYKLKGKGPRFWSKADLEKKGFANLGHDYYLVYEFDTTRSKQYINIPSLARGKQTTSPWFATWSELMDKKE